MVEHPTRWIEIDDLTVGEAINFLNEIAEAYGKDAIIRQPYGDSEGYYVCVKREESDAEYNRRIQFEKGREEYDRKLYEQLKSRFEKNL
jgi:hypothetical protein